MEETSTKQEFTSDTLTFTMTRQPDCVVEYQVKVKPEITKKAHKDAIRSIAKEVSIPGFRKGKAPDHLIVKKFAGALDEKWQKSIADHAFRECQNLSQTPILSQDARITFNMNKYSLEEGAEMTFSFESEPIVPPINIENIELKKVDLEPIDQKKVDETIHQIQMFFAEWEKISDRPAQKDDYVIVDVDVIEEDPPKKALTNARFEVSDEKMAKWMKNLVLGTKIGEAKEGVSTPDEEASEEDKKENPPRKVRLTLKSIEHPKLPEIDAAFVQKLGVKTPEELRTNLERLLSKQANEHVQRAYRDQMNDFLLEHYEFDLPKSLLQKETQYRLRQLVNDPALQQKLMAMDEEGRKSAIHDIEKQGERAVRLFYLSRKIIEDQSIRVSASEVNKEVQTPLEAMFSEHTDYYDAKEQSQEQKAIAMSRLVLNKATDYLVSHAKFVDAPKSKTKQEKKSLEKAETPSEKTAEPKKKSAEKKTPAKKKSEKA